MQTAAFLLCPLLILSVCKCPWCFRVSNFLLGGHWAGCTRACSLRASLYLLGFCKDPPSRRSHTQYMNLGAYSLPLTFAQCSVGGGLPSCSARGSGFCSWADCMWCWLSCGWQAVQSSVTPRFLLLQLNQYDRLTRRSRPKPSASGPLVPTEGQ